MKRLLLRSLAPVAFSLVGMWTGAFAQAQPKVWKQAMVTDTVSGIKFTSLPKEQQDELRKEFAENGLTVQDDALVFFAKRKKDETTVLTEQNGKLLQQSLPKGGVYLVPNREVIKAITPKGPQKIYITTP